MVVRRKFFGTRHQTRAWFHLRASPFPRMWGTMKSSVGRSSKIGFPLNSLFESSALNLFFFIFFYSVFRILSSEFGGLLRFVLLFFLNWISVFLTFFLWSAFFLSFCFHFTLMGVLSGSGQLFLRSLFCWQVLCK